MAQQAKRSALRKRLSQSNLAAEPKKAAGGMERHGPSFRSKKGREVPTPAQGRATQAATPKGSPPLVRLHDADSELVTGKYSMMAFAKEYFRNAHNK